MFFKYQSGRHTHTHTHKSNILFPRKADLLVGKTIQSKNVFYLISFTNCSRKCFQYCPSNLRHYHFSLQINIIIGLPVPSLLSTLKFNFNTATRDPIDTYVNFCCSVQDPLNGSSHLTWSERQSL